MTKKSIDIARDKITIGAAIIVGPKRKEQLERLLPQLSAFDQVVLINTSGEGYMKNLARKFKNVEYHEYEWRATCFKPRTVYRPIGSGLEGGPDPLDEVVGEAEMYDAHDWGFSGARNESFKYLKTTHAIWLDTDDILGLTYNGAQREVTSEAAVAALRKIAKEAPDTDVWFMDYIYSRDEHGNPNVVHARERFLRLECGWRWVYPIHECLIPVHRAPKHAIITDLQVHHLPDHTDIGSSAERNMLFLQYWLIQLEKNPREHDMQRCRLQIGTTFWGSGEYDKSAHWLVNEFLAKHPAAITIEKWQAACFACKSYIQLGALREARSMALLAIDLEPALMDGYLLLAEVKLLAEEDPQDILTLIDFGGRAEDPPPQVIKNPLDYTFTPFCITAHCKIKQGQFSTALDFALKALRVSPNDERAERLRQEAAAGLRAQEAAAAAQAVYQFLVDYDEHEKAAQLFTLLPYVAQKDPEVYKMASTSTARVTHIKNELDYIQFYSDPPGWEPVPYNFFEEKKIPGRDRFNYIRSRIKAKGNVTKVLYLGSDDGFHATLLAQDGYEVTGLELNREGVRIANERAEAMELPAKFMVGWIEKIVPSTLLDPHTKQPFERAYDVVVVSEQIERARDVAFLLENASLCLKPGGSMILTSPDGAWDQGDIPYSRKEQGLPRTVRVFNQETLEDLLNSNREYTLYDCRHIDYNGAYREGQGWIGAELVYRDRPTGPTIRIYCGELVEKFSPESFLKGGIGGSETAVIHMAGNWAQLGCRVVVYGSQVGIYDGVLYRSAEEWAMEFPSDIFIAWRLPHLFGMRPNAKLTVLWNHDISYPIDVKPEWIENIDIVACLTEFHAAHMMRGHGFPAEKIWITRNGIDPTRFMQAAGPKLKHNYFFTSSHDRGLDELLAIWPKVRETLDDVVLHVGYGTTTTSRVLKDRKDSDGLDKIRASENRLYNTEGVVYHQRLNQWELAKLQMECEAWLYPYQSDPKWEGSGGFPETYCITALEAQAAKAWPICRLNGALPEVVQNCTEWEDYSQGQNGKFDADFLIETILRMDQHPDEFAPKIQANYEWAMTQSWGSLAEEWLRKFLPLITSGEEDGVRSEGELPGDSV